MKPGGPTPNLPPNLSAATQPLSVSPSAQEMDQTARPARKTTSEFAIHAIFSEFVRASEIKINLILSHGVHRDIDLSDFLRKGIDENYDRVLTTLSSLAKHRPRAFIDAVMIWRKVKSEPIDIEALRSTFQGEDITPEFQAAIKERKMLASNFILVRILNEIICRLDKFSLPNDLGDKLEEMIFGQLKNAEPDTLATNSNRQMNVDLFAELMGSLSAIRFSTVSSRFINELTSGSNSKETKQELMMRSMRFLKLKLYPVDALDETVEFLSQVADQFATAHSTLMKQTYMQTLVELLTPLSEVATAEVNIPSWMKAVENIYNKALKMSAKPRHTLLALPLVTICLCVSKRDFFASKWQPALDQLFQRLKDKMLRFVIMINICRLVWVYLFRCPEAITATFKKLDVLVKTLFPPGKKYLVPAEVPVDSFVEFINIVSCRYPDYALKNIIFYLMQMDSGSLTYDSVSPERMVVGIKAFLNVLDANAEEKKAPFPWTPVPSPCGLKASVEENSVRHFDEKRCSVVLKDALEKVKAHMTTLVNVLNQNLGAFLLSDEKYSKNPGTMVSTSTFSVGTSDISSAYSKERQPYYELLRAWINGLPWLTPSGIEERDIFDMLCKFTIHIDPDINGASQESLIRICKTHPQKQINVLRAFGFFILSLPDRCADLLERSLKLYTSLLEIWTNYLHSYSAKVYTSSKDNESTADMWNPLDPLLLWGKMQEFETIGLLCLCSSLPVIRRYALVVLQKAAELFELYLSKPEQNSNSDYSSLELSARQYVIKVLKNIGPQIIDDFKDEYTNLFDSYADKKHEADVLLQISGSEDPATLLFWAKCFPKVVQHLHESCPNVVHSCLEYAVQRLNNAQQSISVAADPTRNQNATLSKFTLKTTIPASDDVIEQWRYYVIFTCVSVSHSEPSPRKEYLKKSNSNLSRHITAQELFRLILPLLASEKASIRNAVVIALGNSNGALFKVLVEEMQIYIKTIVEDMRSRYLRGSQKRTKRFERMRAEITHIFVLAADVIRKYDYLKDDVLVGFLLNYIRELGAFLSDAEVQMEWDHQILRYYMCGFIERLYDNICKGTTRPWEIFPFDLRYSLFKLTEEWCGYGQRGSMMKEREAKMILSVLEQVKDIRERGALTAAMEEQRKALEYASLKAMASLCQGPTIPVDTAKYTISFNVASLFEWIESIFNGNDERIQPIARKALEAILTYNQSESRILEDVVSYCYQGASTSGTTQGYFLALAEILSSTNYPCDPAKVFCLILYKLGDPSYEIRRKASSLLREIGTRFYSQSFTATDFEVATSSPLLATFRQAQLDISSRIARDHPELLHELLSEIFIRIDNVNKDGKANLLHYMLPWLDFVDILPGPNVDQKYAQLGTLVLHNLFHATIMHGELLENHFELLWTRLVNEKRNVIPIVQFLLQLGLDMKSNTFAAYAKKIIVYIGRTEAAKELVRVLVSELTPKTMIPVKRSQREQFGGIDTAQHHIANLEDLLPENGKKHIFSRGQLICIYLVDFAIENAKELWEHLPLILHLVFVELDHFSAMVHEHSRMLLISLLHTFRDVPDLRKREMARSLFDELSLNKNLLKYDSTYNPSKKKTSPYPKELERILIESISFFEAVQPDIRQQWSEVAIRWATACPVRHIACRSLQVFRTLNPIFNQRMLFDILARLSNTISDPSEEVQGFVHETLCTLTSIAESLEGNTMILFPQIFWASIAGLHSCNETEYAESLKVVHLFLERLSLNDLSQKEIIFANLPPKWVPGFEGVQPLIAKGFACADAEELAAQTMGKLMAIEDDTIVDSTGGRWLSSMSFFLPRLLDFADHESKTNETGDQLIELLISKLSTVASLNSFARLAESARQRKYRSKEDFLKQFGLFLKETKLSDRTLQLIIYFFLKTLKNEGIRDHVLMILRSILKYVGRDRAELISSFGSDLIRPLVAILNTESRDNVLTVLDEVMAIFEKTLDSSSRFLFGNKVIHRMAKTSTSESLFTYSNSWSFNETDMEKARQCLNSVVATYLSNEPIDQDKITPFFATGDGLNDTQSKEFLEAFTNDDEYEQLLTQLESLENFFQDDGGTSENDHLNINDQISNNYSDTSSEISSGSEQSIRDTFELETMLQKFESGPDSGGSPKTKDFSGESRTSSAKSPKRTHFSRRERLLELFELEEMKNWPIEEVITLESANYVCQSIELIFSKLYYEVHQFTRQHLLNISGLASSENCKYLISLIRTLRAIVKLDLKNVAQEMKVFDEKHMSDLHTLILEAEEKLVQYGHIRQFLFESERQILEFYKIQHDKAQLGPKKELTSSYADLEKQHSEFCLDLSFTIMTLISLLELCMRIIEIPFRDVDFDSKAKLATLRHMCDQMRVQVSEVSTQITKHLPNTIATEASLFHKSSTLPSRKFGSPLKPSKSLEAAPPPPAPLKSPVHSRHHSQASPQTEISTPFSARPTRMRANTSTAVTEISASSSLSASIEDHLDELDTLMAQYNKTE